MANTRKSFVCLALSLLAVVWTTQSASAQRFRWWKDDHFVRELALTPEQGEKLEATFQEALPALRAQHRALSNLEDELSRLIQEGRVEESELEYFVAKVESARAELAKTRTMMIYRMRRVLTTEQNEKLQKLFEEREKDRRGKRGQD